MRRKWPDWADGSGFGADTQIRGPVRVVGEGKDALDSLCPGAIGFGEGGESLVNLFEPRIVGVLRIIRCVVEPVEQRGEIENGLADFEEVVVEDPGFCASVHRGGAQIGVVGECERG